MLCIRTHGEFPKGMENDEDYASLNKILLLRKFVSLRESMTFGLGHLTEIGIS